MTYDVSLKVVAIVVGILICLINSFGILVPHRLRNIALGLARNFVAGIVLLLIADIWTTWLLSWISPQGGS